MNAVICLALVAQPFPDWPRAHNDLRNTGYTSGTGALSSAVKRWEYTAGADIWPSSPAVADAEGDGAMEVYFGSEDGYVYCVRGTDGTLKWRSATGNSGWSSPAIADLDGNGVLDCVVGGTARRVLAFNGATGAPLWTFTAPVGNNFEWSTPTVADLDGNGTPEVIVPSSSGNLYVLRGADGTVQRSYGSGGSSGYYTSPAVADLDGDGSLEVVYGRGNDIVCLDSTASFLWSYTTGGEVRSAPALADLDGDGSLEVACGSNDGNVYCLEPTGAFKWSYSTGSAHEATPAVADVDADGQLEVIVSGRNGVLRSLDGATGALEWAFTMTFFGGGPLSHQPVAIADLDGDGTLEVACVAQYDSIYVVNGATGAFEWAWGGDIYWSPGPVVADVDGDMCVEVLYGGDDDKMHVLDDSGDVSGCVPVSVGAAESRPRLTLSVSLAGRIVFTLPEAARVSLSAFDPSGRRVATLASGLLAAGEHVSALPRLPRGVYVVRIVTPFGGESATAVSR